MTIDEITAALRLFLFAPGLGWDLARTVLALCVLWLLTGAVRVWRNRMTIVGYAFTDAVSGQPVYYCEDKHGNLWLAENRWSSFRVEAHAHRHLDEDAMVRRLVANRTRNGSRP